MNLLDMQRRWHAEMRRRNTIKERVEEAGERAEKERIIAGFPLCGECGHRHPSLPKPLLDEFRRLLESGARLTMDDPLTQALSAHSAADGGKKCH